MSRWAPCVLVALYIIPPRVVVHDFKSMVHLLGKSLHYLDEENKPKQIKSENNRLELRSDSLIALDNEIKRWQDILSVDYNKWLFDD